MNPRNNYQPHYSGYIPQQRYFSYGNGGPSTWGNNPGYDPHLNPVIINPPYYQNTYNDNRQHTSYAQQYTGREVPRNKYKSFNFYFPSQMWTWHTCSVILVHPSLMRTYFRQYARHTLVNYICTWFRSISCKIHMFSGVLPLIENKR